MTSIEYSPDILEQIDVISKKTMEKRRVLQEFMGILQTRADLEEYYSNNLEKIGQSLTKLIHGKDGMKDVFLILKNFLQIQTEQTRGFARQLKNDVVTEIQTLLNQEPAWQKDMETIGKKHQKEVKQNIIKLGQLRGILNLQLSILSILDEYIASVHDEKRVRFFPNTQRKSNKSILQCEQQLETYVQQYNQYIEVYFQDLAQVQDTFQNIELQRRQTVQDTALKYLIFEISVIRNLQYDLNGISSKLEAYNAKADINELFKEQPNNKPLLSKLNFEDYKGFLNQQLNFKPEAKQSNEMLKSDQPRGNDQQQIERKKKLIFETSSIQPPTPVRQIPELQQRPQSTHPLFLKLFQTAFFDNIVSDGALLTLNQQLLSDKDTSSQFINSYEKIFNLNFHQQEENVGFFHIGGQGYISLLKILTQFFDFLQMNKASAEQIMQVFIISKQISKSIVQPDSDNIQYLTLWGSFFLQIYISCQKVQVIIRLFKIQIFGIYIAIKFQPK